MEINHAGLAIELLKMTRHPLAHRLLRGFQGTNSISGRQCVQADLGLKNFCHGQAFMLGMNYYEGVLALSVHTACKPLCSSCTVFREYLGSMSKRAVDMAKGCALGWLGNELRVEQPDSESV